MGSTQWFIKLKMIYIMVKVYSSNLGHLPGSDHQNSGITRANLQQVHLAPVQPLNALSTFAACVKLVLSCKLFSIACGFPQVPLSLARKIVGSTRKVGLTEVTAFFLGFLLLEIMPIDTFQY